jgi:hypothetical protein
MKTKLCLLILINVKDDLIQNMINNLFQIEHINEYKIVFWHNSLNGNSYYDSYTYGRKHQSCAKTIIDNIKIFDNAEYFLNEPSYDLYIDRYNAIEYCFNYSDNVIYVEDDIIFSKNFINYFLNFIDNNYKNKYQFIAGESILFDSSNKILNEEHINIMKNIVEKYELNKYFTCVDYTPSSCLLYNIDIWNEIKKNANGKLSMDYLNSFCKINNYKTVIPIVAECADIGMLHDTGYSMVILGKKKISEIKNVYILNDKINTTYICYNNIDKLYDISSNLNITDDNINMLIDELSKKK